MSPTQEPSVQDTQELAGEGDLFEAIRTIIYKRVSSQVDTHFIDRIHLVGVPDAAAEITKLVLAAAPPPPATSSAMEAVAELDLLESIIAKGPDAAQPGYFKLVPELVAILDGCPTKCPVHQKGKQLYANTGALFRLLTKDVECYRDSDGRRWEVRPVSETLAALEAALQAGTGVAVKAEVFGWVRRSERDGFPPAYAFTRDASTAEKWRRQGESPTALYAAPVQQAGVESELVEPVAWRVGDDGALYPTERAAFEHVGGWRVQNMPCDMPVPLYSAASLSQLQQRIAELEGERDETRRKLFPHADANPICGFSYGGFYFISDEKGIKEFRRLENNANQIAEWRRGFDENITAFKARAEAAEAALKASDARLAEAVEILEPFAKAASPGDGTGDFEVPDGHPVKLSLDLNIAINEGHLRRARSFTSSIQDRALLRSSTEEER